MSIADKVHELASKIFDRATLRHAARPMDADDQLALSHLRTTANEVYADGHLSLQDLEVLAAAVAVLVHARANTPDVP